ncbi:unnamed protein product, partial [Prorocentrum cordatum]
ERGIGKGGRRRRAERRAAPLPQTGQDAGAAGRRGGDGGRGPAGGPGGLHGMGLGEGGRRRLLSVQVLGPDGPPLGLSRGTRDVCVPLLFRGHGHQRPLPQRRHQGCLRNARRGHLPR